MEQVITYNFSDNFIDKLADFLIENFYKKNSDLSRIACVFGGKRPALFLRRKLAKTINKSFIPPRIFSMDDFINYLVPQSQYSLGLGDLDAAFLIYTLARKSTPQLLKRRTSFSEFLPWAREIVSFIEQLDLEDIRDDSLYQVEKSAEIGYEIPESINRLLQHIVTLRDAYHKVLGKKNIYSRGMKYRQASRCVKDTTFDEFEKIVFCNFFYLHATEQKIIKTILKKGKGICLFQGSENDWSVLEKNAKVLGSPIRTKEEESIQSNISFYQGFDLHSQVCLVRKILNEKVSDKENTLIVLPRAEALIPLISEISSSLKEFNISLGYPLKRSPLYTLCDALFKVQESRKNKKYYTKDYLNFLRHPLVKNLKLSKDPAITRVMVHKIEDLLEGGEETSIGGSLFLSLEEIEGEEKIYRRTSQTLQSMDIQVSTDECRKVLGELHNLFLYSWEELKSFDEFADRLNHLLKVLVEKSMITRFPFNLKAIEKLYAIKEEFQKALFSKELFSPSEIWEIFRQKLESEMISFVGSPLRGTQILGLFETRSLNFENVIIMDVNESTLPKLKIYEPLIPREVMLSLGLNRLEKEEEIQHYHFMRLISNAKEVHLVYEENQEKEKSRFIEELLWRKQKLVRQLEVVTIPKACFSIAIVSQTKGVKKTPDIVKFLKRQTYSASRLNVYLDCPLRFYYQYVLGLEEKEDLLEDPQAPHIGSFIHKLLEDTFRRFEGKKPLIDTAFRKYFFKNMEEKFEREISRRMKSDSILLKKIIENRLNRFLDNEIKRNVAKVICLEEKRTQTLKLNNEPIQFTYTVDRIDKLEDKSIMIIDYKTGGADLAPKRFSALQNMAMTRQAIKESIKSFQLPLYHYFVSQDFPDTYVNAELYNLRTLEETPFIAEQDYSNREEITKICLKALGVILEELFNFAIPFIPDKNERRCQYCAFRGMCS